MSDDDIVGRIMDKAASADRQALFAAVQAACLTITDLYYAIDRPNGPEVSVFFKRMEDALRRGAPLGPDAPR